MRTWLFYKIVENGSKAEFRRFDQNGVSTHIPPELQKGVSIPRGVNPARAIELAVVSSGWAGDCARPADSVVGQTILRGSW